MKTENRTKLETKIAALTLAAIRGERGATGKLCAALNQRDQSGRTRRSLALLDYVRGAACAALLFVSASAFAGGYDTYAGSSGLVTTVQIEQAKVEAKAAADFRNMSIADRWDLADKGSIAARWSDAGPGSIAARWNQNEPGSIARRWENK